MKNKRIKTLTIVTSVGTKSYGVRNREITEIKYSTRQISSGIIINIFEVYKGDVQVAEVSASVPYDIEFFE